MTSEFVLTAEVETYVPIFTEEAPASEPSGADAFDFAAFEAQYAADVAAQEVEVVEPEFFVAGVQTDEYGLSVDALAAGLSGADAYVFEDGTVGIDAYLAKYGATGDEWTMA